MFPRLRVAVFVDGCFWHGCPDHGHVPRANTAYWAPKLARNVARDRSVDQWLAEAGWEIIRVWEHLPSKVAAEHVASGLESARPRNRMTA